MQLQIVPQFRTTCPESRTGKRLPAEKRLCTRRLQVLFVARDTGEDRDTQDLEADLRGNTLRVYWYMLQQSKPVGVREVQRALGMSSPSVASHHLTKLLDLDLVTKQSDNSYELKQIVKVGTLRNFVAYRGVLLPRYAFVAFFFTAFTMAYLVLTIIVPVSPFDRYVALALGVVGALFGWFETYRLWRIKLV
jgi:DNA-binding transcriptional ArsR family regulator